MVIFLIIRAPFHKAHNLQRARFNTVPGVFYFIYPDSRMAYYSRRGRFSTRRRRPTYRKSKRRYGKKRYGRTQRRPAYKRQSVMKSKGADQLAVYVNPWSTATTNPKIPDGKCRLSTGLRLQAVREYLNDDNGEMEFIIFPGCACGLSANNKTVDGETEVAESYEGVADLLYENHGTFTYLAEGEWNTYTQEKTAAIAKWRLVSQAVRFTLINNADENDGWFEAIRFDLTNDYGKLNVKHNGQGATPGAGGSAWVSPGKGAVGGNATGDTFDNIYDNIGNLVEHPSYISGKLRDIHRYQFQLRAIDSDHDFRNVDRQYYIHNDARMGDSPPEAPVALESLSHEAKEMKDALVDLSYDFIYVRIHGRPAAEGVNPTRIMTHCVANQEIMYEQGSAFSRYHTETDASPYFKTVATKLVEGNIKAGWKSKTY